MIPTVVFACVRNGGRSVIARTLAQRYADTALIALSAGTQPGEHIHPEVARGLSALGVDTSAEEPTLLTTETLQGARVAITLGCGEECPYVPGVEYRDWPITDPGGQSDEVVAQVIAEIDAKVRDLIIELVPGHVLPPSVLG